MHTHGACAIKNEGTDSMVFIDHTMFRIEYIGASWCAPCRTTKPVVSMLAHKFACSLEEHDYDEMEEEAKSTVLKLPTIRVWDASGMRTEITTSHAEKLESWLRSNVRVNTEEDF